MSTRLIIIIVMLGTALAMGFILVWPKYNDFHSAVLTLKQKEAELNSKMAYYSNIKEAWGELEKYEDAIAKIDSAIPDYSSMPVLFNYFQKTSGETGLILEGLTFGEPAGDKIKETSIQLQVTGDYSSFKNFLSAVGNSARFFEVKNIGLSSSGKGKLSFNLEITTYSY
ncbi:MAG: type 4a pilus biogenesis protein PilO [bacterium]|nr:type 4a pilus biogenesis protein PilO [bacterium]